MSEAGGSGISMVRSANVTRNTKETQIQLQLVLDGNRRSSIRSGIPFFDHMLELMTWHGGFDLDLTASGDLSVDYHHTVEDVGIVFGEAVRQALSDKRGIQRYGFFYLPMDESLARVVVDLGGRSHFVWQVEAPVWYVRDFHLGLIKEFFQAWANACAANLHIRLEYGEEPHHIAEAIFKGFGRALAQAAAYHPRLSGEISSKGVS